MVQPDKQECPITPINNAQNRQAIMAESAIIACPDPPDKDARNVQAVMADVDRLECRIRAGNLYTEITTETTCRDYNTYPPYPPPPEEKQPGECVKHQDVERSVEVELADNPACEDRVPTQRSCLEATNLTGDNCSAARTEDKNRYQRNQPEYPKNLDGSDHLPWDTTKRGVFDPEFEQHMARSLMAYPAYQNLMFGELMTKVRKHISAGRYDFKRRDELLIEWEAMQEHDNANDFLAPTIANTMTAKAAARRAKIARALNMEV